MGRSWRVERDPWTGCDLWRGSLSSSGYPTDFSTGAPRQAYLVALERAGVVVPPGKEADHLCRRPLCVAPAHFEIVTRRENQRRKQWSYRSQLKRCPKGHEYATHGRRTDNGGMVCRLCSGVWAPNVTEVLE